MPNREKLPGMDILWDICRADNRDLQVVTMLEYETGLLLIESTKKIDNSDMSEAEKEQARNNLNKRIKRSELVNAIITLGGGAVGQSFEKDRK